MSVAWTEASLGHAENRPLDGKVGVAVGEAAALQSDIKSSFRKADFCVTGREFRNGSVNGLTVRKLYVGGYRDAKIGMPY